MSRDEPSSGTTIAVLAALALVGCGGQIGDSGAGDDLGATAAAGTLPAPKDPQCERVIQFAGALERSQCGQVWPVDLTDGAACVAAGDALDACFADGACRLDVGARLLAGCHGLIPWWPCMGAASYDACVKAEAAR